jgi:amino acid transporter
MADTDEDLAPNINEEHVQSQLEQHSTEPQLQRSLGILDGISVIIGIMIGTGIFASPGIVVSYTGNACIALLAWTLGGMFSLLGALCFAELGAEINATGGGQY